MSSMSPEGIGDLGGGLLGGGSLTGTNTLQQSVDSLTTAVNRLSTIMGSAGRASSQTSATTQAGAGGGFPPVINPFSNNPYQPGIGGGGNGGSGNVQAPVTFGQLGARAGLTMVASAFAQYGNQQMQPQLGLDAYVRISQLGLNTNGGWTTNALRSQAFGMYNQNLNALASSPMDALAMTQQLQFLGGSPLYGQTALGQAGYGAAASFGMANPALSGSQMAGLAQQIYSPALSQRMLAMGYRVTPRALGGGPPQQMGAIMQSILRGWYNKNSVTPRALYSTLSEGGRGYANLQAMGLDPTQIAPALLAYNKLFQRGISASAASRLFTQAGVNDPAGAAARATLNKYGVQTTQSDIQAIKNAQSVVTGRMADTAGGFNAGLKTATGLLQGFNKALSNIMTNLGLNAPVGFGGGFMGTLSGTSHGPGLLGAIGMGAIIRSVLGGTSLFGGGAAAGDAVGGGMGSIFGGGAAASGITAAAGPFAIGIAAGLILKQVNDTIQSNLGSQQGKIAAQVAQQFGGPMGTYTSGLTGWIAEHFFSPQKSTSQHRYPLVYPRAYGGMIPGYSPGNDTVPAMLSPGEAVLTPDAARAIGPWNIHNLNSRYRPSGARSGNGFYAAGGHVAGGGNPGGATSSTGPVWPFATKSASQYRRIDQGWDLQYGGTSPVSIFAVESGTLRTAGPDPNGFGISYPLLQLDKAVGGAKFIYYGHTMPDTGKVGRHVGRGEEIGHTGGAHSGGNAYGLANWLEIGFWNGGPIGNGGAMKNFLLGSSPGGGSSGYTGTTTTSSILGPASGLGTGGAVSGIGFSEAGMIPNISELSSLMGGTSSSLGIGSSMMTTQTTSSSNSPASSGGVNLPGGTPSKNMAIGKQLAAKYGWSSGTMWNDLVKLWNQESGWNNKAMNPSSQAYGIPQSLPWTKMPKSAWPPSAGGTANAGAQIGWGLNYIKGRYGDPSGAWAHEQAYNWYGSGGHPAAGSVGVVGDRGPELVQFGAGGRVLSNSQTMNLLNGNTASPAQSPWRTNLGMGGYGRQAAIYVVFEKESIVIRANSMPSDASAAGREVAKQIVKHIHEENVLTAIANGERL